MRAWPVLAAVAAAALLVSGCGSGGGHKAAASTASGTAGATAPATDGSSAPGGGGPSKTAPGSAADGAKVPDAQLTPPGGGTFTGEQKKYLSGRVPKGTDPVAILEGGQDVCDRLTRTSAIDPDAAASAVVSGDIAPAGATAAVRDLCPDQGYVLAAAARGFADGTFAVAAKPVAGKSVAPGRYHAPGPSPTCSWRVAGAGGKTLAAGKAATAAKAVLDVPAGARTVTSTGCAAWLPPIAKPGKPAKTAKSPESSAGSPTPSGGTP